MVVECEAQRQQQTALEHTAWHGGIADGAQQNRVVTLQLVDDTVGQGLPRRVIATSAEVVLRLLDTRCNRIEDLEGLTDDFGPDAVAGDDGQFHARSTTSSRLAPTASAMSARSSAGTSRSMRIRIVALPASASSLSCAA